MAGSLSLVTTIYTDQRLADFEDLVSSIARQRDTLVLIVVVEGGEELKEKVHDILSNEKFHSDIILCKERIGLSGARNIGVSRADTDYVGFVDDDAVLDESWSKTVINDLDNFNNVIGVTGPVIPLWEKESDAWFPRPLYWLLGCSDTRTPKEKTIVNWAAGTNMVFRRKIFDNFQFDERRGGIKTKGKLSYAGDENEFVLRIRMQTGKGILYSPSSRVYHKVLPHKTTLEYIRRYSFMQGYAEAEYKRKFPEIPRQRLQLDVLLGLAGEFFLCNSKYYLAKVKVITSSLLYFVAGYSSYALPSFVLIRCRRPSKLMENVSTYQRSLHQVHYGMHE